MIFSKEDVFNACEKIAPKYNLDPKLIKALCLQESSRNAVGDFLPDRARLEQGFYIKYVEPKNNLATTTEVLLSASYGVTQLMGLSLKELNYFDWWFNKQTEIVQLFLDAPLSEIATPKALNWFCENLDVMIDFGCQWFKRKLELAKGDKDKALDYWNGDLSGKYREEVWAKYNKL